MVRKLIAMALLGTVFGAGAAFAQEAEEEAKLARFGAMVEVQDLERGRVMATRPGRSPEVAFSYRAYPYETRFVVEKDTTVRLRFSDLTWAVVTGPASVVPHQIDPGEWHKVALEVQYGDVDLAVDSRVQPGQFTLTTALGAFTSLQGSFKVHVGKNVRASVSTSDEDFSFRTLSGTAVYEGLHYKMGGLTQANSFSSSDTKFMRTSAVTGVSGEVRMELPMGAGQKSSFALTPGATVKITRAKAPGSDNWVVSVLTLYANGEAKNYFCYVENRGKEFATGELIAEMLPSEDEDGEEDGEDEDGLAAPDEDGGFGEDELE